LYEQMVAEGRKSFWVWETKLLQLS